MLLTLLTDETVSLGKSKLTRYRLVLPLLLLLCLPLLDNHRNMVAHLQRTQKQKHMTFNLSNFTGHSKTLF